METPRIWSAEELAEAVENDEPLPVVIDGNDLMMLHALADRVSLLAPKIQDPDAAEAVRLASYAVLDAARLLTTITSALHHGAVAIVNYPEAMQHLPGVTWQVESQGGRLRKATTGLADPHDFVSEERQEYLRGIGIQPRSSGDD